MESLGFDKKKIQPRSGFTIRPEHPRTAASSFAEKGWGTGGHRRKQGVCGSSEGGSFRFCFGPITVPAEEAGGQGLMFSDGSDGDSLRLCRL